MAKVIVVGYTPENSREGDEEIFIAAMEELAVQYKRYHEIADFGVVESDDIASITFDEQCFYPRYLKEALERQGIRDVRVRPFCGGDRLESVFREIEEKTGEPVTRLNFHLDAGQMAVAYQFERGEQRQ
ncbi:MAG: hypothetical protein PHF67_01420 [Candidatus Nanoarchaeia archaeon]|nr:hypothetical protein [Candidatus Nanoarchaeia archaeon]